MKQTLIMLAAAASFIFSAIGSPALAATYPPVDVPAGPIWNNADAPAKCNNVCSGLQWNRQWNTTQPGLMSVCGTTAGVNVAVGPIPSNLAAQQTCPSQLKNVAWNGNWKTTQTGVMSVCGCAVVDPQPVAPPITPPFAAAWLYMSDDQNYNTIPPQWNGIDFKQVDVLYVGPAGLQGDGTFGLYNSSKTGDLATRFKWVVSTARNQNPAIKIIVSQWWGNGDGIWGSPLNALQGNAAAIAKYTASVATFVQSYLGVSGGVDGYDVDYEDNNVIASFPSIASQIRTALNTLGKTSGNRPFYLTASPSQIKYLQATVPSLNFVNMQTYAGGSGLQVSDFIKMGLTSRQLLYGICPESHCPTKSVADVESAYTANNLAGIHLWRLNSDNYVYEGQVQSQIYTFLHP